MIQAMILTTQNVIEEIKKALISSTAVFLNLVYFYCLVTLPPF